MNIMNPGFARRLTLSGYFGLMIGIYAWHLIISQTADHLMSIVLIFQLGPLMFPLRGLLSGKIYTHAWSIYLAIFYFIMGVWYSAAGATLLFGLYLIATSLLFFSGTVLYTRLSTRKSAEL